METKTEIRKNRFTGESIELTKEEAAKYDAIIHNELAATMEDKDRDDVGISSFWDLDNEGWRMATGETRVRT